MIEEGAPIISNNTIMLMGGIGINILGNNTALVYDNHISNNYFSSGTAISVGSGNPVIERNFLNTAYIGIKFYGDTSPVIENNTLANNFNGLVIYGSNGSPAPIIMFNNFEQKWFNIVLGDVSNGTSTSGNVNATNNWWGTTDEQAINQKIWHYSTNLAAVNFLPILNSSNPQAMPNPNAPIPIPSSTPTSPSESPSPPQASRDWTSELVVAAVIIVIVAIVGLAVLLKKRRIGNSAL